MTVTKHVCQISAQYVSGNNSKVSFNDLPQGRLIGLLARMKADFTTDGAGAIIPGSMLCRLGSQFSLTDRVLTTGRALQALNWQMKGSQFQMPQDIPIAAAAYSRFIDFYIPFVDQSSERPLDTAINADLIRGNALTINWGNAAALFPHTTLSATDVRVIAYLESPKPDVLGAVAEINADDQTAKTVTIEGGGALTHLFIYSEDSDALTDTLYANFTIQVGAEVIMPTLSTGEVIAEYDIFRSGGTSPLSTSTGIGGELIPDEPGTAGGAGQGMTIPFIPLITPPFPAGGYSLTHCPYTSGAFRIVWQGTATGARFAYRRVRNRTIDVMVQEARALGLDNPASRTFEPDVAGFGRIDRAAAQFLPHKVSMSPEEIRTRGGIA